MKSRVAKMMGLLFLCSVLGGCQGDGRVTGESVAAPGAEWVEDCPGASEGERTQRLSQWLEAYGALQWRRDVGGGHVWSSSEQREAFQEDAERSLKEMLQEADSWRNQQDWAFVRRVALCRFKDALDNRQRAAWEVLVRTAPHGYAEAIELLGQSSHPNKQELMNLAEDFERRFCAGKS